MLTCEECGQSFERKTPRGTTPKRCPPCRPVYNRRKCNEWHQAHPEQVRVHKRRNPPVTHPVCERCGEAFRRASMKGTIPRWCTVCTTLRRAEGNTARQLRRRCQRNGITVEQYEWALAAQGGACAICKSANWGAYGPHIDHDHTCCPVRSRTCGKCFRGLLCQSCNHGIGNLKDDPVIIAAALAYVTEAAAARAAAPYACAV